MVFLSFSQFAAAQTVTICGEPWPPFVYETAGDDEGKKKIAGLHTQNFRLISELTGLDFAFSILPWKRCLQDVENYAKPGEPEIAIDASFSTERAEKYHLVGPIYAVGTAVFYSRDRYPEGPFSKRFNRVISTITDMQDFKICGLLGWNYESYYIEHDIPRSVTVMETPAGMPGVFSMVSKQRCDVVEIHPELVIGAMITGELAMPADIACRKLDVEPENFFLMVSRKSPRAEELVTRLSGAFIYLKGTEKLLSIKDDGVLPASKLTDAVRGCV